MIFKITYHLPFFVQTCNAGLNFANVNEARNFLNEIEKKLQEKLQRRQGTEIQMQMDNLCNKDYELQFTYTCNPSSCLPHHSGQFILVILFWLEQKCSQSF